MTSAVAYKAFFCSEFEPQCKVALSAWGTDEMLPSGAVVVVERTGFGHSVVLWPRRRVGMISGDVLLPLWVRHALGLRDSGSSAGSPVLVTVIQAPHPLALAAVCLGTPPYMVSVQLQLLSAQDTRPWDQGGCPSPALTPAPSSTPAHVSACTPAPVSGSVSVSVPGPLQSRSPGSLPHALKKLFPSVLALQPIRVGGGCVVCIQALGWLLHCTVSSVTHVDATGATYATDAADAAVVLLPSSRQLQVHLGTTVSPPPVAAQSMGAGASQSHCGDDAVVFAPVLKRVVGMLTSTLATRGPTSESQQGVRAHPGPGHHDHDTGRCVGPSSVLVTGPRGAGKSSFLTTATASVHAATGCAVYTAARGGGGGSVGVVEGRSPPADARPAQLATYLNSLVCRNGLVDLVS